MIGAWVRSTESTASLSQLDRNGLSMRLGFAIPPSMRGSFVVLTIAAVAGISLTVHSWPIGIPCGVAVGVLLVLSTRRNHRRRLANGTSAEYGAPS